MVSRSSTCLHSEFQASPGYKRGRCRLTPLPEPKNLHKNNQVPRSLTGLWFQLQFFYFWCLRTLTYKTENDFPWLRPRLDF